MTPRGGATSGFTLIEMLVVVAIMALIAGLGFPACERAMRRSQFETDSRRLYLAVVQARADALSGNRAVGFGQLTSADGLGSLQPRIDSLPADAVLTFPQPGLVFFPDGSSSGGEIRLVEGSRSITVSIAAETGLVRIRP